MREEKPSILLVEDEYLPALHLKTVLAREGHEVFGPAARGVEAVDLARTHEPDIVLMDVGLAGKEDGIETARRIRTFSGAAFVFMSGYQEQELRDRAMDLKPLAYLVKPVILKDIRAAVGRYGRAAGAAE